MSRKAIVRLRDTASRLLCPRDAMRIDKLLRLTGRIGRLPIVLGCLLLVVAAPLPAQRASAATIHAAVHDTLVSPRPKSVMIALLAGSTLPGSAHWYAGESNRGWLVAAIYWTGVAISFNGRTDRTGKIGGAAFLGAYGFSIIDGIGAVQRYNRRLCARDASRCRR